MFPLRVFFLMAAFLATAVVCWNQFPANRGDADRPTSPGSALIRELPPQAEPLVEEISVVEIFRQKLVGTWRDDFYGQRTLTFHADGTGRMRLDLDLPGQFLYGPFLEFDFRWTWKHDILTMEMIAGRPVEAAKSVSKAWGEKFTYAVPELTSAELQMRVPESETVYKLRRVEE